MRICLYTIERLLREKKLWLDLDNHPDPKKFLEIVKYFKTVSATAFVTSSFLNNSGIQSVTLILCFIFLTVFAVEAYAEYVFSGRKDVIYREIAIMLLFAALIVSAGIIVSLFY